jgi:diguanylate cyclase (GGDEF)-like protein
MTPVESHPSASCTTDSEEERLRALYRYDVLDTPPEESFDRITRLAKLALQAPMAMVSLVDRDRQWFKSRQGTETAETPRSISFCTHTIREAEPLVVPDALNDPRFRDSPLVTGAPHVRSYAGVPLRTPDGHNIGALCVNDTKPREVTQEQINVLEDLARLVVDELELRLLASIDSLTGAMTKRAFVRETVREFELARRHSRDLGFITFDVDHFKKINDTHGHPAGDHVLSQLIGECRSALRTTDLMGRVGGEEFAILLPETRTASRDVAETLRRQIAALDISHEARPIPVTASFGVTALALADRNVGEVISRADAALYRAKFAGRNRVEWAAPTTTASSIEAA